jgi:hypothetical protein
MSEFPSRAYLPLLNLLGFDPFNRNSRSRKRSAPGKTDPNDNTSTEPSSGFSSSESDETSSLDLFDAILDDLESQSDRDVSG